MSNPASSQSPHTSSFFHDLSARRPSWAPSLTESLEPRHPPPEYRHYYTNFNTHSHSRSPGGYFMGAHVGKGHVLKGGAEGQGDADGEDSESEEEDGDESGRVCEGKSRHGILNTPERGMRREWVNLLDPPRGRQKPANGSHGIEASESVSMGDGGSTGFDEEYNEDEGRDMGRGIDVPVPAKQVTSASGAPDPHVEPASPEFPGTLRRSLQIDMKDLVGDAVGNMSISPASRDIVLAARRGLFIIDLDAPLEVPRFLPQGGTWDVADVQWNPHHSRAHYIVSTSAEKLLIWNLFISGKTNIQHILQAHYRAITDINWHPTECDTVVSTGIDSWLWAWDLREPRKPIFGLSAFKSGGTQVKWNRQDANILASSHANEVFLWDRRKGSLPLTRIRAHTSKIYGIDWSHDRRNEIVTCSLDRTIKLWDITDSFTSHMHNRPTVRSSLLSHYFGTTSDESFQLVSNGVLGTNSNGSSSGSSTVGGGVPGCSEEEYNIYGPVAQYEPKKTIYTLYPVWRARNLPFGRGVLSLAQRGESSLEMYSLAGGGQVQGGVPGADMFPIEVFEGHTDVVKEFVWRKSEQDEFQLITWSKDRTLKFWPIDAEVMQKVGHTPEHSRGRAPAPSRTRSETISFRSPPGCSEHVPALSAPIGNRSILAEVRATLPQRLAPVVRGGGQNAVVGALSGAVGNAPTVMVGSLGEGTPTLRSTTLTRPVAVRSPQARIRGETMSRGNVGGKSVARMDAFTWLSNVKVGERRGSSSGAGSRERDKEESNGTGGGEGSRLSSRSRRVEVVSPPSKNVALPPVTSSRSASSGATTGSGSGSAVGTSASAGLSKKVDKAEMPGLDRKRSESQGRAGEAVPQQEAAAIPSLQDEITTVLTKLAASKIKLEKHELTKKRTCTLGLHGPWGLSSQVFIRVTFTFPRDYPQASYPNGIPIVDLERNPLIPIRNRAFMLRRLRTIRERRRPCLEACLRFLLFADEEDEQPSAAAALRLDSESSSDDDDGMLGMDGTGKKKGKGGAPAVSMLRNNKNLAEPRTSQGVFGPNGQLVCFFRTPPRIVKNVLRGLGTPDTNDSANSSTNAATTSSAAGNGVIPPPPSSPMRLPEELPPLHHQQHSSLLHPHQQQSSGGMQDSLGPGGGSLYRSPALVSEAVWMLGLVAKDRMKLAVLNGASGGVGGGIVPGGAPRTGDAGDIHRVMTNMLTFASPKLRRDSNESQYTNSVAGFGGPNGVNAGGGEGAGGGGKGYAMYATRSTVFLATANELPGPDQRVAVGYMFRPIAHVDMHHEREEELGLAGVCERNAQNARVCGRFDHERVWRTLKTLFASGPQRQWKEGERTGFVMDAVAKQVIVKLYTNFNKNKDIQMLAMVSMLVLQTPHAADTLSQPRTHPKLSPFSLSLAPAITFSHSGSSTKTNTTPNQGKSPHSQRSSMGGGNTFLGLSFTTTTPTSITAPTIPGIPTSAALNTSLVLPKIGPVDYFNLTRVINSSPAHGHLVSAGHTIPSSPDWPRLPTSPTMSPPHPPPAPPPPPTTKGPWSSLFGPGGVRQFVQDTFKDGLVTPSIVGINQPAQSQTGAGGVSGTDEEVGVPGVSGQYHKQQQQAHKKKKKDRVGRSETTHQHQSQQQQQQLGAVFPMRATTSNNSTSSTKSWGEALPMKASVSASSASSAGATGGAGGGAGVGVGVGNGTGEGRTPFGPVDNVDLGKRRGLWWGGRSGSTSKAAAAVAGTAGGVNTGTGDGGVGRGCTVQARRGAAAPVRVKKMLLFEPEDECPQPLFERELVEQFRAHVNAYAEILHRWKMDHQRLELLKAVSGGGAWVDQDAKGYEVGE
ncbi:hypothetical protein AMATHDRAFT_7008 [Amanita thiersii Skay4041]|uniref:Uncharacterized protein n=1 Tax=Amanita thiersii Skay4041 TaxID=703135 RepID=A0A2A9NAU7_9AGAR|nr:hypothetical protein AMATHDRAFT_7008 [Amanita thiersii Skay4041]